MKKVLLLGASTGLGRSLAELFAKDGHEIILVARNGDDLKAIQADLQIKYKVPVEVLLMDVAAKAEFHFPQVDYFYLIVGGAYNEDLTETSYELLQKTMDWNFLGPVKALLTQKPFTKLKSLAVISSIAAIRPRATNKAYSASKSALESYVLSLRHHFAKDKTGTAVQVLRLGYMRSRNTAGKDLPFPVAEPQQVAEFLYRRKDCDLGLIYYPRYWCFISIILKSLPWFLFKKMRV